VGGVAGQPAGGADREQRRGISAREPHRRRAYRAPPWVATYTSTRTIQVAM
jgi:hypothetical protein